MEHNDGGNSVIPPGQLQDDFQAYVQGGGGFLAVHAAGAFIQDWPWLYAQIVQPYWHYNQSGTFAKILVDPEVQGNQATAIIAENLPATITISDE